MDFIRKYKCILDFSGEQDLLILTDEVPCEYSITLHDCPEHLTIPLPARSEVIRPISFDTEVEEVFVPQQMLQNGVFIANTITTKSNPLSENH
ncbi:Retrovirus-related Pol polyprotein from transposon 412 [Lucilia cuprina]|nr:Retrovirus-related Pol polyprotein from transposon 412 [Lucilia cuprina]